MTTNQSIRTQCLKNRRDLSKTARQRAASSINHALIQLKSFQQAQHIAFYAATADEVSLAQAMTAAQQAQKTVYLPVIQNDKTFTLAPFESTTVLQRNKYGIQEPLSTFKTGPYPLNHIDIMLVPLVGFSANGSRVGMGQGYYDRTLAKNRPQFLLGIAFDIQRNDDITAQSWDIPMDAVLTEKTIYWRHA